MVTHERHSDYLTVAKYRLEIEIEVDETLLAERGGRRSGDPPVSVAAWKFGDVLGAARRRMVDPTRSRVLACARRDTDPLEDVVRELARRERLHPGHLWTRVSFPGESRAVQVALEELEREGTAVHEERSDGHVGWRLVGCDA